MKKIAIILLMALCVPLCTVYAQDCSDRIQSAGKLYDKYKKSKDKKQLDEARKQLMYIVNTPGNPEKCRKEAANMLKTFKPVIATKTKSNVDIAPIVVKVDTVVNIESIVNVLVKHDSMKVKRFYESESAAMACAQQKDYECAIDQYQTAVGYGKELSMGEEVIRVFESKIERNKQLQFNMLLDEAKQLENSLEIARAITAYERAMRYGVENSILNEATITNLEDKISYLQSVQQMFEFVEQADEFYRAEEWAMAKDELDMAIELSDSLEWRKGTIHWIHRRDTIERIITAGENIFDYKSLADNSKEYEQLRPRLAEVVQTALLRLHNVPNDTLTIEFLVYPDGKMGTEVSQRGPEDLVMQSTVKSEIEKSSLRLSAPRYYGKAVTAKATYHFVVEVQSEIVKVSRRSIRRVIKVDPLILSVNQVADFLQKTEDTVRAELLPPGCRPFLYGNFFMNNTVVTVDNKTRSGFDLVKYRGKGGPANALLSMVVPGLGRHRVTYGKKLGIGTTLCFFGSLGASIGLRYWSLQNNPNNTNNNMDWKSFFNVGKYDFQSFENINQGKAKMACYYGSYALAGIAAVIYVSDVVYTLVRGSVNVSRQRKYKKWSIGVFYEPATKTPILQYNYKIK
ncbi:MAG: hypothetical protein IKZ52_05380 [Bacteroidales bacterium]|nr:hypothetical protein [Bacteroidales bacterium]